MPRFRQDLLEAYGSGGGVRVVVAGMGDGDTYLHVVRDGLCQGDRDKGDGLMGDRWMKDAVTFPVQANTLLHILPSGHIMHRLLFHHLEKKIYHAMPRHKTAGITCVFKNRGRGMPSNFFHAEKPRAIPTLKMLF